MLSLYYIIPTQHFQTIKNIKILKDYIPDILSHNKRIPDILI